jgi:hypothetical protein
MYLWEVPSWQDLAVCQERGEFMVVGMAGFSEAAFRVVGIGGRGGALASHGESIANVNSIDK